MSGDLTLPRCKWSVWRSGWTRCKLCGWNSPSELHQTTCTENEGPVQTLSKQNSTTTNNNNNNKQERLEDNNNNSNSHNNIINNSNININNYVNNKFSRSRKTLASCTWQSVTLDFNPDGASFFSLAYDLGSRNGTLPAVFIFSIWNKQTNKQTTNTKQREHFNGSKL